MVGTAAAARTIRQWGHDALPNVTAGVVVIASHLLLLWLLVDRAASPPVVPTPALVRMRLALLPPAAPPMPVAPQDAPRPTPDSVASASPRRSAPPLPAMPRPALRPLPAAPLAAAGPLPQQEGSHAPEAPADAALSLPAAAPSSPPAPPAPHAAGSSDPNWEGRVLARLQRFRNYPRPARNLRQEGVVFVRARLDRQGRVLSASVQHGSGYAVLDQEALATFRRAQPLPRSPDTLPDPVDVEIPVEFFLR